MNVCCNKLFRAMSRNRRARVVDASLALSEEKLSEIKWWKAVTIKPSEDWIKRQLHQTSTSPETETPIFELTKKFEYDHASYSKDNLTKHYYAKSGV